MKIHRAAASTALALLFTDPSPSQTIQIRSATSVQMPSRADSNSPVYWRSGQMTIFNSTGEPVVSRASSQFFANGSEKVQVDTRRHFPMWIEAVWRDQDGTLYAWYHHEPGGVCAGDKLTAPKIGALVSYDEGRNFTDLGIVLEAGDPADCNARNGFFAGGHGDFSVIADRERAYFYFFFDNYGGEVGSQGVAIARMAFEDRANPVGAVWKYHNGEWKEPGIGGPVSPIFPARTGWQQADTDSFWGPSIHWNTHLEAWVILMNRACCRPGWPQEGIYLTVNRDLSDPWGWTPPVKILGKVSYDAGFYPQVIGTEPGESDSVAGQVARLYVHGRSDWEIVFGKYVPPDPEPEPPDPDPDPVGLDSSRQRPPIGFSPQFRQR